MIICFFKATQKRQRMTILHSPSNFNKRKALEIHSYMLQFIPKGLSFTKEVQTFVGKYQRLPASPMQQSPERAHACADSSCLSSAVAEGGMPLSGSSIAGLNFTLPICEKQTAPLGLLSAAACCTAVKQINNLQITPILPCQFSIT